MLPTFSPTSCISFQEPPHQLRCTCRVRALYVSTGSVSNVTLQSSRRHPRHVTLNCELPCTLETGTHLCVRTNKLFSAVVIPFGATFRSGRWVRCFAAVYKERRDWTMGARALPPPPPPPPHGFTLPGGWDDKASPRCDWCVRFARTFPSLLTPSSLASDFAQREKHLWRETRTNASTAPDSPDLNILTIFVGPLGRGPARRRSSSSLLRRPTEHLFLLGRTKRQLNASYGLADPS